MQIGSQAPAFNYTHIAAAGTTLIKTGPGYLHTVSINTIGVGAGGLITIADNVSGVTPAIAVISGLTVLSNLFDLAFVTGLFITVAAFATSQPDITISWN